MSKGTIKIIIIMLIEVTREGDTSSEGKPERTIHITLQNILLPLLGVPWLEVRSNKGCDSKCFIIHLM